MHDINDEVLDRVLAEEGSPPPHKVVAWDPSDPPADPSTSWRCPIQHLHPTGMGWNWCAKARSWWWGRPGAWYSTARRKVIGTSEITYSYWEWCEQLELGTLSLVM